MHRRLHVNAAEVTDVGQRRAAPFDRSARRGDEVREAHPVEPALHLLGIGHVEESVAAVRRDAPARGHLHLQRERPVGQAVATEQLVPGTVLDEQAGDSPVAEVEHEARALVPVVEEVGLPARGDEEDGPQLVLGDEHVARDPQCDRRAARDVVVLDRVGARRAEPVCEQRRHLPDRVVLPHRPVVHDDVDRLGIDARVGEERLRRPEREVAHVLVLARDMLAAQAELLDDHALGNAAPLGHLRRRHPAFGKVGGGGRQRHPCHPDGSRTARMIRPSSSATSSGTLPSPQRIQRMPIISPTAISAHAATSGSIAPIS